MIELHPSPASCYGKQDIPIKSYQIPMLTYAPQHLQPQRIKLFHGQRYHGC